MIQPEKYWKKSLILRRTYYRWHNMKNIHQSILCTLVKSANEQINSWFVDQGKSNEHTVLGDKMDIPRQFSKINPKHKDQKACISVSTRENMDKERGNKITKYRKTNLSRYKINVTIFSIPGELLLDQFLPLLIIFFLHNVYWKQVHSQYWSKRFLHSNL